MNGYNCLEAVSPTAKSLICRASIRTLEVDGWNFLHRAVMSPFPELGLFNMRATLLRAGQTRNAQVEEVIRSAIGLGESKDSDHYRMCCDCMKSISHALTADVLVTRKTTEHISRARASMIAMFLKGGLQLD